jgi:hypothetical protein
MALRKAQVEEVEARTGLCTWVEVDNTWVEEDRSAAVRNTTETQWMQCLSPEWPLNKKGRQGARPCRPNKCLLFQLPAFETLAA